MPSYWYYTRDGRMILGPLAWQELKHLASTGELLSSDVVGQIRMSKPVKAATVAGLFGQTSNATEVIPCLINAMPVSLNS